MMLLKFVSK